VAFSCIGYTSCAIHIYGWSSGPYYLSVCNNQIANIVLSGAYAWL
jgi:hypothetical protein